MINIKKNFQVNTHSLYSKALTAKIDHERFSPYYTIQTYDIMHHDNDKLNK
jgi:hypothetical protein